MSVKLSVITPVLNEVDFIGYCVMAALPVAHEFIYLLDEKSSDGTRELLWHLQNIHARGKIQIIDTPNFHPSDTGKYNAAFNEGIKRMTGDAAWFLHPDMIVTDYPKEGLKEGPLAFFTHLRSFAKDLQTVYTKGRCNQWKNIHMNQYGLHYFGDYGGIVEDWYHRDITGNAHSHYQTRFDLYPFDVGDSGIYVNHYCEMKPYARRLEKMKTCLKAQYPGADEEWIEVAAAHHPRVTLEPGMGQFGTFEYAKTEDPIPDVFVKYKKEFESFKKEPVHA